MKIKVLDMRDLAHPPAFPLGIMDVVVALTVGEDLKAVMVKGSWLVVPDLL